MSEPFLGEIKMWGGNFAPRGYAFCDGQLLAISQNSALFSLLGTTYGGDGRTTFALPDLRGRAPVHAGSGPGLTPRQQGQRGGTQANVLNASQLPPHQHALPVTNGRRTTNRPAGAVPAQSGAYSTATPTDVGVPTASTGGGQAVNNMPPFLVISFIIALQGVFPSRS